MVQGAAPPEGVEQDGSPTIFLGKRTMLTRGLDMPTGNPSGLEPIAVRVGDVSPVSCGR